jgi:hypothetical protein
MVTVWARLGAKPDDAGIHGRSRHDFPTELAPDAAPRRRRKPLRDGADAALRHGVRSVRAAAPANRCRSSLRKLGNYEVLDEEGLSLIERNADTDARGDRHRVSR